MPASAPFLLPDLEHADERRLKVQGGGLQVVVHRGSEHVRVAGPQRLSTSVSTDGRGSAGKMSSGRAARGARRVPGTPRESTTRTRRAEHPRKGPWASAGDARPRDPFRWLFSGDRERHIGAELAGEFEDLSSRGSSVPHSASHAYQRGRRTADPPPHAAGHRTWLLDLDVRTAPRTGLGREQTGGGIAMSSRPAERD